MERGRCAARGADGYFALKSCDAGRICPTPQVVGSAVALLRGPILFTFYILVSRFFEHRTNHVGHRVHPLGNLVPLLAVPLLDEHWVGACVILTGNLDRWHEAFEAKFLQACLGQFESFEAV